MNRIIKYITAILVIFQVGMSHSAAQTRSYTGNVLVKAVRMEQVGNLLHVDIDFIFDDLKVKSAHGMDLIPQLVTPERTYNLPKVSFKGRDEYLSHERKLALIGYNPQVDTDKAYVIEKVSKKKNGTLNYRYTLPYESWMAYAALDMQYDECGCGDTELMRVEGLLDPTPPVEEYIVTPYLVYIQPPREEIKRREIHAECFLDFEVNQTVIRPYYMNNPQELAKIRNMINDIKDDPNITINRLDITGFASPEGTLAGNQRLSEGRSKALANYLATQYDFPRNIYHISFGGENWAGLVKAVEAGHMEYRNQILDIIEYTPSSAERKDKLKKLAGGVPYRHMLRTIYPSLRVAICKVDYNVKNFDVEEAKIVILTRPQDLSLNEMFLVANTYQYGSQEFVDVFETAVRLFPKDEIANLNAAISALTRNDMVLAERYLNRITPENYPAEYNNAMGVLALLQGNYERAETYLQTAAANGLEVAKQNLEELARKKANAIEIEKRNK